MTKRNGASLGMRGVVCLILIVVGSLPGQAAPAASIPLGLDAQLRLMLQWWPGEYSNARQVAAQRAAGVPESERIPGVRFHIARVDLPAFGEHVYYAEWQDLDDPSNVTRQRFYGFAVDEVDQSVRLDLFIFNPARSEKNARALGAYKDPGRVSDFTPEDMVLLEGANCDIYFRREGRQFRGEMKRGACAFAVAEAPGGQVYSWTRAVFGPDLFWYSDGWFLPEDDRPYQLFHFGRFVELDKVN